MATADVVGTISSGAKADDASADSGTKATVSEKPSKILPTDRISFSKQLAILRGYAALATQTSGKVPTNPEVAELVGIHPSTSTLIHPFLVDVNALQRSGTGFIPAAEVIAYGKAHNWNTETAPQKLAPLLRRTWFADALLPHLAMGPKSEKEAIAILADASGAGPKYESQLRTVLEYCTVAGIIQRDGDTLRRGGAVADQEQPQGRPDAATSAADDPPPPAQTVRVASVATAFAQVPEGVLRFSVDVNVDLKEFATWTPDRIAAFWSGIAQVLAAKADVEGGAKKG